MTARLIHKVLLTLCLLPLLVAQDYGSGTPMVLIAPSAVAAATPQIIIADLRHSHLNGGCSYV